ncbi:uncharacterized protein LOC115311258 [Ixodes scapularis]|uniref:uncharacterized protein LOC115311258 n=1 Tax=Ixodes scapularis TaxID=6945 RepID=UPI001A9D2D4C|nr:uncharacterized protein LOC115311258 [Ixodes scapularis]
MRVIDRETAAINMGSLVLLSVDVPQAALVGGSAKLECRYRLADASLYPVKRHKDGTELFRYLPGDYLPTQVYHLRGVTVNVTASDATSVLLKKLSLASEGTYRCEVSSDAPSFATVAGERVLSVRDLPKGGPKIGGSHTHYRVGDTVDVYYNSPKSRTAVSVSWFLNGIPVVPLHFVIITPNPFAGFEAFDSRLRFSMPEDGFINGTASMKCVATIPSV